ncbi:Adenylosuccinate synthetase [Planctomycetales bacterium 10988]|nr:Adenylosuccinate synthetase [Planctomycetales bacterium 10988]
MPATCVIGLQWGDEAKGKIVDLLSADFEMVVRYQGGANAGHTVVIDGKKYAVSLVPSGIFHPGVQCIITGGAVIHPPRLLDEIKRLRSQGIEVGSNLLISDRAHVIFPWHTETERVHDALRCPEKSIGTTMRGIGPCYQDKAGRQQAIRIGDLYRSNLKERIAEIATEKNMMLAALSNGSPFTPLDADAIYQEFSGYAKELEPYIGDSTKILLDAIDEDRRILFEGAQGALLDIDHGTFPFVTSSNSSGAGISSGSGVPGKRLDKIIGVLKAYNTRVGGGPFPTELDNELGDQIRTQGNEFGTVTGRPRRCGWFDAVAARYSARVSGADCLAISLLDVLSGLPEVSICTAYDIRGKKVTDFPSHVDDLADAKPILETVPGWDVDLTKMRSAEELPASAMDYLKRLEDCIGRPIEIVSVGPDREQTMFLTSSYA